MVQTKPGRMIGNCYAVFMMARKHSAFANEAEYMNAMICSIPVLELTITNASTRKLRQHSPRTGCLAHRFYQGASLRDSSLTKPPLQARRFTRAVASKGKHRSPFRNLLV
jgi:hypothetical protein